LPYAHAQVLKTIGDCHYKSKNISEAIVYLKRSLDMQMALVDSESVTSDLDISTLLQSLGAFHKEAGEFETALSYFLQSHERKKKTHGTEAHPEGGGHD
jgi:tetratricopeptide (TPR) repeat protein